eukprot:CAMPEP_0180116300 /NCGR_PEP_ID=MMETSP0986-20121125/293_1 /TAXON_ID=697907 /ORGANISM="non described non described, Strain CCMP2293" /LENGTH=35 /DNA_ID= /DNA_START= /DNA_END= /DNA_ORIENTATION=
MPALTPTWLLVRAPERFGDDGSEVRLEGSLCASSS